MKVKTFKGITFRSKRANPYQAHITLTNRNGIFQKIIGAYKTVDDAVKARNNFIDSLK